jgi:two-component system NtrC family sensor kinase
MPADFRRLSLKAKLITSYLVILGIGGLATSVLGSWIVSSTIMMQASRSVSNDLATARTVYQGQLRTLEQTVALAGSGITIQQYLAAGDRRELVAYLQTVRRAGGFDFLNLTDGAGRVILRLTAPERTGDVAAELGVVRAALAGRAAAAAEILSAEQLEREDPRLRRRARLAVSATTNAAPSRQAEQTSGLTLLAAAPVRGGGALYGGALLNRNFALVDRVWELLFKNERYQDQDVGNVTIFAHDVRVSTNVRAGSGERALGTLVSAEVRDAVLGAGRPWLGRAFVVSDWFITAYEPLLNFDGKVVGILAAGRLEAAYTSTRNRVILSFFAIATIGFVLIIGITYYMIRNITRPIGEMVAATQSITAGRFDQEIYATAQGEIALLAESFNTMLKSLRQMKGDLEEWGRTLEEKVRQRTDELVAMQARVAQSERLASLGMLAAGVAHEINNPLGGILALTALTLEDLPAGDPNRENLEEVRKQSERCRDIVRGLLEFSRQTAVNTEMVDINRILQEMLALVGKQAMFFNITVVKEWDPDLPPVMADRSQLQQVFMNILMNGVQAMEEKGTVTIVTRRAPADGHVEVVISDSGCGIPPDVIDRIFDPFFTTKASGKGTGLGLSIAYGIVTEHRGTISVASEVGKGTTFTVRLPAAGVRERATA